MTTLRLLSENSADTAVITVANTAGNSSKAPLKLTSSGSIPTDRTVGSIAFIGGWLCFCNGTDWYQSDGTKLT